MKLLSFWLLKFLTVIFADPELTPEAEINDELSPELLVEEAHEPRFFAVVIDAGSTGTRLHVFEFRHTVEEEATTPFELLQEISKEVNPGLSSFADNPKQAAKSIEILLSHAKNFIPERLIAHTPIILQATAGLRLLSEKQADTILHHVRKQVQSSRFLLGDKAVGILSGRDEGIFAWFTLNFLTGRLSFIEDDSEDQTAIALDLGGGSTQISFYQRDYEAGERSHQVNIFGREFGLYTHSYLGNGLIAARLGIASLLEGEGDYLTLKTHCLPPNIRVKDWAYAGRVFQVVSSQEASFEKCLEQASEFVVNVSAVSTVEVFNDLPVFAFSYFYDRGVQAGMVRTEPKTRGGWVKVKQYRLAAEQACRMTSEEAGPEHWKPWLCMDLTYIYALLSRGYGAHDEKNIHLTKKVRDMEVSWALGAGFHLLNSYHKEHIDNFSNRNATNLFKEVVSYISSKATNVLVFLNLIS